MVDSDPWPHRPGSGYCRWPDLPMYRLLAPAGTHDEPRLRGSLAWFKPLKRIFAEEERALARLTGRDR